MAAGLDEHVKQGRSLDEAFGEQQVDNRIPFLATTSPCGARFASRGTETDVRTQSASLASMLWCYQRLARLTELKRDPL